MEPELQEQIERETILQFARSSGAGGQNVNKVSTKVIARLPLERLTLLSEEERGRVREALQNRISRNDEIVIHVEEERRQVDNRRRALQNLEALIEEARRPETPRKATRPSRRARRKRVDSKRRRGEKKQYRKPPSPPEE